jgi:hypothetical protein
MAGTINLALTQQLDEYGEPISGGQLYFIQAGTVSTPQNAYQDTGLTIPLPNPITLDAAGRVPQFFLADGQIKVRLQDKNGVIKFQQDNLLVIGPSAGGGGGGGSVDPTTVLQTGDVKIRYDTAIISGFVRLNGKTIGSASSGATELADPSAQPLFNHLWAKDSTLAVTPGGRGASAAADWAANKQITLPDGRARLLMALADMGNSDIGALASVTFAKGNATTLGSIIGAARAAFDVSKVPAHQHTAFIKVNDGGHSHPFNAVQPGGNALSGGQAPSVALNSAQGSSTGTAFTGITCNVGSAAGLSDNQTTAQGGGQPLDLAHVTNPALLLTVYMKL